MLIWLIPCLSSSCMQQMLALSELAWIENLLEDGMVGTWNIFLKKLFEGGLA